MPNKKEKQFPNFVISQAYTHHFFILITFIFCKAGINNRVVTALINVTDWEGREAWLRTHTWKILLCYIVLMCGKTKKYTYTVLYGCFYFEHSCSILRVQFQFAKKNFI